MKNHPIEVEDTELVEAVADVLDLVHRMHEQSALALTLPERSEKRCDAEIYVADLFDRIAARARQSNIQPAFLLQCAEDAIRGQRFAALKLAA